MGQAVSQLSYKKQKACRVNNSENYYGVKMQYLAWYPADNFLYAVASAHALKSTHFCL
mgnify:CR=1 FL=1